MYATTAAARAAEREAQAAQAEEFAKIFADQLSTPSMSHVVEYSLSDSAEAAE